MKIAIMYICTGKYKVFWKEFFESYEKFFLCNCEKHYFVFTDAEEIENENDCDRIHRKFQKQLGWPMDTLMRFQMFDSVSDELVSFDYVFFMNANCKCVSLVTEEEFLPQQEEILVVQHPGQYKRKPRRFTYERNARSTAYIKKNQGQYYICGGINGGKTQAYLSLIKELKNNIQIDLENGIIAKWHDESHINHYIVEHQNWKILSPSFCFAEGWKLPFEAKIIVRDKNKYFDTAVLKLSKTQYFDYQIKQLVKKIIS